MFAVSQIIERNLHRRKAGGPVLWINPERDDCWRSTSTCVSSLRLFTQDYGSYRFLRAAGADTEFSAFPQADHEKYDWIIVNLPRQKALLKMLLHCASALLADDGVLWLAGENKAGIKSAGTTLKLYFKQCRKLDNARHCGLYEAGEVLQANTFHPSEYRERWVLNHAESELNVISYPGVFAHGRLDEGTGLLLDELAKMKLAGDVIDFACGAGVIGASIAARNTDASVTMLDSSALAVKSCEETLEINKLNCHVLASDGLSEIDRRFDLVVSNPPIHAGAKTDNQLGMRLLDSVHTHIRPGGKLILVANIHLPYEKWLGSRFKRVHELATNQNFKVITAG